MKGNLKAPQKMLITLFITWCICFIWMGLEFIVDGAIVNRNVDNIIMVLMMPFIWGSVSYLDLIISNVKEKE